MLGLVAGGLTLTASVLFLVKLSTTDGDFTLTSRGPPKRREVEGKVVWLRAQAEELVGILWILGEVLAHQFTSLGAKVILSASNTVELERVKSEIISKFPNSSVELLPVDLASGEQSLKEAVQKAESLFSSVGVDFMVHNAASERPKRNSLEETVDGLRAIMEINVLGTITLTRLLAPCMLKRGRGHFVVMSSAAGKCPAPSQALYSASKHDLNEYFHTLRSELCQKGIKVTVVCPGPIETSKSSESSSSGRGGSLEGSLNIISACPICYVLGSVHANHWILVRGPIGANRLDAAANKKSAYACSLLFGHKKSA